MGDFEYPFVVESEFPQRFPIALDHTGRMGAQLLGDFADIVELDFDGANDTTYGYQRIAIVDPGTYDVSVAITQGGAPTTASHH